jgi:hypothetical protein
LTVRLHLLEPITVNMVIDLIVNGTLEPDLALIRLVLMQCNAMRVQTPAITLF